MKKISVEHYKELSQALSSSSISTWYNSPELWICQDYDVYWDGKTLFNDEGIMLIPPAIEDRTILMNYFMEMKEKLGSIVILFAPSDIKQKYPYSYSPFEEEVYDVNYVNSVRTTLGLQGNKLKTLRKNLHKFESWVKGKDFTTKPLTKDLVPKAIELCEKYHYVDDEYDDLSYNTSILMNSDRFNLIHRTYHLDGEMVAINAGSGLNDEVAAFLISKSEHGIKYLVDYVRWDFHRQVKSLGYTHVNDGSDLGNDGLKQLKKKFNPVRIEELKTMVWE